jgi:hypothetical protein
MTVAKEFQEHLKQFRELKEEIKTVKQQLRELRKEEKFWNNVNEYFRSEEVKEIF